jgi:hypothetical protein
VEIFNYLNPTSAVVFLVIVLGVSIVAGSLLMIAVSVLLLAVFAGLAYRARLIERSLDRD